MQKITSRLVTNPQNSNSQLNRFQHITQKNPVQQERKEEYAMWEQSLDFYLSQIAYMKTRLSSKLDHTNDKTQISAAENFLTRFVTEDDRIKSLQRDLLTPNLNSASPNDQHAAFFSEQIHLRLKQEMQKVEKIFLNLKEDFNIFFENN